MIAALLFAWALWLPQDSDVPAVDFGSVVVVTSGFKGTVYKFHKYAPHLPSNFSKLKALGEIYTNQLNVPSQDFSVGFPGVTNRTEGFAIDYTGRFWVAVPGVYRFSLESDDGSKLYIDDKVVVDNDGVHPPLKKEGSEVLGTGIHAIRVSYFQGPKYRVALVLKVAPPNGEFRVFRMSDYKPPADWKPE